MDRHLDEDLNKLKTNLLEMAIITERAIHNSIEALITQNKILAENTIIGDEKVDDYENKIKQQCIELLALHQPMAKDLRFITMAMGISDEIERIADLTVNICQRAIELASHPQLKPYTDMPKLAENAKIMVKTAIDAFVQQDEKLAKQVIRSDSRSNELRTIIMQELINDYMMKDSSTSERAVHLVLIARDFERISDHAASIAEDIIYLVEAVVVRHHPERLED